jgi:hypothetical protein
MVIAINKLPVGSFTFLQCLSGSELLNLSGTLYMREGVVHHRIRDQGIVTGLVEGLPLECRQVWWMARDDAADHGNESGLPSPHDLILKGTESPVHGCRASIEMPTNRQPLDCM